MNNWQKMFVGRDRELEQLIQCWEKAQAGTPQLAVLLAPPGMGKTRLVQEFYHHVSKTHDGAGEDGYWPDQLGRERDRFALSCQAEQCNPANPMTMLWWAIKCIDTGSNNAASSDLLVAYNQFLKPHLDLRRTDEQRALLRREQLKESAKGFGDLGIAAAEKGAELIPVIGPFVGLAKAIGTTIVGKSMRLRELEKERSRLDAERLDLSGKAGAIQEDFEEQLMGALGNFARPRSKEMPPCPMIIVVDDAQFADQDPALRSFLRRFIDTAWAESWPVLVIMTHWTYEWNLHGDDVERIPGLIQTTVERGLMDASIIPLGKIAALDRVLATAIPELPEEQASALLAKAGGNARYLDRLVQLLLGSPAMFVAREARGALHEDALEEILREGFDLHDVTRRLFDLAPDEARRAAALASMQGERFLHDLVAEVGENLSVPPMVNGLEYCANPLAVISDTSPGVGEFSQGMFREVARSLVSRTVDRESVVKQALIDLCRQKLDDWEGSHVLAHIDPVSDLLLLDLIIGLTQVSRAQDHIAMNIRARLRKGALLTDQGDLEGARAIIEGFDSADLLALAERQEIGINEAVLVSDWHKYWSQWSNAKTILEPLLKTAELIVELSDTPDARRNLGVAERKLGDVLLQIDGPVAARPHYEHFLALCQALADELRTPAARRDLAAAEGQLGNVLLKSGDPAAARPHFEHSLALCQALADELCTPVAQRDLSAAASWLGKVLLEIDGPSAARPHFERSLALCQALANELGTPGARKNLSVEEGRLGDVLLELGDLAAARSQYESAFSSAQKLAEELGTPDALQHLAVMESKFGDILIDLGEPAASLRHYKSSLALLKTLAEELDTHAARRDLAIGESRLGDAVLQIDGPMAAHPYYKRSHALFDKLAQEQGTSDAWQQVAISEEELGYSLLRITGAVAARPHFQRLRNIAESLAEDTGTISARRSLAVAEVKLGDISKQIDGPSSARVHYERSLALYKALANELNTPRAIYDLKVAEDRLSPLSFHVVAASAESENLAFFSNVQNGFLGNNLSPAPFLSASETSITIKRAEPKSGDND